MLYLLDANVLISAHNDYYPIDRIPQFWEWLAREGVAGRAKISYEIYEEIADKKDDLLAQWIAEEEKRDALMLDEEANKDIYNRVVAQAYAPDLNEIELQRVGRDPFLIAYALMGEARCVVTKEVSKPSKKRGNRKVPNACEDLGVPWMTDFEFYRNRDFRIE